MKPKNIEHKLATKQFYSERSVLRTHTKKDFLFYIYINFSLANVNIYYICEWYISFVITNSFRGNNLCGYNNVFLSAMPKLL